MSVIHCYTISHLQTQWLKTINIVFALILHISNFHWLLLISPRLLLRRLQSSGTWTRLDCLRQPHLPAGALKGSRQRHRGSVCSSQEASLALLTSCPQGPHISLKKASHQHISTSQSFTCTCFFMSHQPGQVTQASLNKWRNKHLLRQGIRKWHCKGAGLQGMAYIITAFFINNLSHTHCAFHKFFFYINQPVSNSQLIVTILD